MMLVENYVERSTLHGTGLFTRNPLIKGMLVWKHVPSFDLYFTHEQMASFPKCTQDYLGIYVWSSQSNPNGVYYDSDNARFTNHSDTPNLIPPPNGSDFELYAAFDIPAGTELCCDYRKYEPDYMI
jgi:SET domain-containing protein